MSIRICICKPLQRHLRHHNSCATEVAYDSTLDVASTPDCNFTSWNTRILANGARGAALRGAKRQCRQCCSPTVAQAPFPPPHVRTRFHKQKTETQVGTRTTCAKNHVCVCSRKACTSGRGEYTDGRNAPEFQSRQTFETRLHVLHHLFNCIIVQTPSSFQLHHCSDLLCSPLKIRTHLKS